jgi:uncharacterized OB-fold protein
MSKLGPCPSCGHSVSHAAKACPHCGYPVRARGPFNWLVVLALVGVIFSPLICAGLFPSTP